MIPRTMFPRIVFYLFGLFVFSGISAVQAPYEVGTWENFCQGAISHTFDDWPTSGATQITASGRVAFNEKNLHFTMFINTDGLSSGNWNDLKSTFADGHEVASHNQQHNSNASGLKPSQEAIRKNVPGEMCVTIAYPNCNTPGDQQVLQSYIAGRNCSGQLNDKSPTNWAQINAKGFGTGQGGYSTAAKAMNDFADQAASGKKWAVTMHHGIGSDRHSWATTTLDDMKNHLTYLDQNRDKIWCETFGNVARYIQERDAVAKTGSVAQKDSTDKGITVTVTDGLPDSIFNYPLTIQRPLPDGWTTAVVTQKGEPVEDSVLTVSGKQYIRFKAVPDGGDVVISKNLVSVLQSGFFGRSNSSHLSWRHGVLAIDRSFFTAPKVAVTLLDLTGKIVGRHILGIGESNIPITGSSVARSAFIAKVTSDDRTSTGIFIPQL